MISDKFEGILWIQLIHKLVRRSIGICACYLPPSGSSRGDQSSEFFDSLKALIIENYSVEDFVICGDFNARCGNLDEITEEESHPIPKRVPVDTATNKWGKELIVTMRALDLCIANGRFNATKDGFTSVSNRGMSVVDYIISPIKSFKALSNFRVIDPFQVVTENSIALDSSMPDHRILTVNFTLNNLPSHSHRGRKGPAKSVKIKTMPEDYMLNPNTLDKLNSLARELNCSTFSPPEAFNLNKVYDEFCTIIDNQLKTKQIKRGNGSRSRNTGKEWWNDDLGALAKEVRRALKLWEANKSDTPLKLTYLKKQKEFSKTVRRYKRIYRRDRSNRLLHEQKRDPRKFWDFIKKLGGDTRVDLPDIVTSAEGECVKEPEAVKREWRGYFQKLLNPSVATQGEVEVAIKDTSAQAQLLDTDPSELNDEICVEEVKAAIYASGNNKSPGTDGIRPAFIKNDACVNFIHALCNHCFKTGTVPDQWLKAIIKPIPKGNKGSTIPSEYRGISLQSFVAKAYCRILNNRIRDYLENNSILSDEQNGFRPNRCCQDHIFTLASIIENRIMKKRDTFACFIDFKKAFDCVNRELLWDKLKTRYNLRGEFLEAIKALYSDVRCAVDVNSDLTEWFGVNCGVKQGCILSPTLFAMYIDDLVEQLRAVNAGVECGERVVSSLLYADDIVLLAPDVECLQKQIKIVEEWCSRWRMTLNIAKTKVVHFRKRLRSRTRSDYHFAFNNQVIEYSEHYKYLGLLFTEHLDWGKALEEIHRKANRALALLNHRARACGGLHFNTYSMLFNQLVHSIIMCNACIWGHSESKVLASIQLNALRFLLGVGKACPIAGLFGESGWVPYSMLVKFNILRFWKRIMRMWGG